MRARKVFALVVLLALMSVLFLGMISQAFPAELDLISLSANRDFTLLWQNKRQVKENSVLVDLVLTNLTGTWFQAEIEFNPLRKNVAVTEKQIPYVFLMGPYQQKTFKDIEFFEEQVLWFNLRRDIEKAPAAFAMLAIDMICRGLFTEPLSTERLDKLFNSITLEELESLGEALGKESGGLFIACAYALAKRDLDEASKIFVKFVISTKAFKEQLWKIIKAVLGKEQSVRYVAYVGKGLSQFIDLVDFPKKANLLEQLSISSLEASWDDIVWLTARKKSEKRSIIELVNPLQIMPCFPVYYLSEILHAKFGISNNSASTIKLKQLVVGGRGPEGDNDVQDFLPEKDLLLETNTCYLYKGMLKLTKPGEYHFFCAYQESNGQWHPSIDLGPGLTDTDRIQNIKVSQLTASASFKAGAKVKVVSQLGLWLRSSPKVINEEPHNKISPKTMPQNTELIIVSHSDNGLASDGYYWWLVQYKEQQGWCAEANYRRTDVFLSLIPIIVPLGRPSRPQHIDS